MSSVWLLRAPIFCVDRKRRSVVGVARKHEKFNFMSLSTGTQQLFNFSSLQDLVNGEANAAQERDNHQST